MKTIKSEDQGVDEFETVTAHPEGGAYIDFSFKALP